MLSRFVGVLPRVPLLNGADDGVIEDALLDRLVVLNVFILSLSSAGDCNSSASSDKRNKEGCLFVFIDLGLTRGVSVGSTKGRRPLLDGVLFDVIVFSLSCEVLSRLDLSCLGGGDKDEVGCN
jgi:hypothetical protein